MIESAEAMVKIHDIAKAGEGHLDGLLFAAEDCMSTILTPFKRTHFRTLPGRSGGEL
jgi:citrate lyase beta subunit